MTQLRVILRIPSDDAFELKAQALNNDSRLKKAGIAALKFTGDQSYLVDGDFSPEASPQGGINTASSMDTANTEDSGNLHVFVRLPNEDSYELKAQALNTNPDLKSAGIKALRRVGDKKYIADGGFSADVPLPESVTSPPSSWANAIDNGKLHVFVQVPNDDSYELKAQALNSNPDLKKAGISALRRVGDKKYIKDGDFPPGLSQQEVVDAPTDKDKAQADHAEKLYVFVRIPNDDSYELKTLALNREPLLKAAGIKALRRTGDKRYIMDGEFASTVPPQGRLGSTPSTQDRLHVVIRMKDDDAYELISNHLNGEPLLQDAGVSLVRLVPGEKSRAGILPVPKKKRRLRGCLTWTVLLGILAAMLTAGGAVLAYGSPQAALTQIASLTVPDVLTQIAGGPPSATATLVPPTETSVFTSTISSTPTNATTPTRTRTPTRTPTPTATLEFLFTITNNANCRSGPSTFFASTESVTGGGSVPIRGYSVSPQDNTSIWWLVLVDGNECYVSDTSGTANVPTDQVTFIQPPAFESGISGQVYDYGNNIYPAGETVELYTGSCSGTPVLTEVTDSSGNYYFDYIPAGSYCVRVVTSLTLYSSGGPAQISVNVSPNQFITVDFELY